MGIELFRVDELIDATEWYLTLYDVDDENRQHIERHSQQIEEGEANPKTSPFNFFPSYRRVVGSYNNKIPTFNKT